jgi:spoIIIJ-associated protein
MSNSQQRGVEWLEQFLTLAGTPAPVKAQIDDSSTESSCWLVIDAEAMTPDQANTLIGQDGKVLDAMQYIANTVLNLGRNPEEQQPYTVELGGYRVQRQAELRAIADSAAQEAIDTAEEVEIPSLSAAERRQLHTMLKAYGNLETYSRGKEPDRRLVVRLVQHQDSQPQNS